MAVCSHCGEVFPDHRLNCPHCGADKDQEWSPDPEYGELGIEDEEQEYRDFLEREGLSPPSKGPAGRTCGTTAVLVVLICAALLLLI